MLRLLRRAAVKGLIGLENPFLHEVAAKIVAAVMGMLTWNFAPKSSGSAKSFAPKNTSGDLGEGIRLAGGSHVETQAK